MPDGDFLDLNWLPGGSGPIVIVLHGLQGSVRSRYAIGVLRAIERLGWRAVFLHFRGCSGEPNRLARSYHAGETADLAALTDTLRNREPGVRLAAVGYSLGGNVLLKWLGELGARAPLFAAVAVSVPFDLEQAVARLGRGFSRLYQRRMLRCLCAVARVKFKHRSCPIDYTGLIRLRNLRDYDNKVTAPLHGYVNADEYYAKCSSRQYLKGIGIPTLILHAADDPFMTPAVIPRPDELSESISFELSERGGHVGFVSGNLPWEPRYWLETRIPEYLASKAAHLT